MCRGTSYGARHTAQQTYHHQQSRTSERVVRAQPSSREKERQRLTALLLSFLRRHHQHVPGMSQEVIRRQSPQENQRIALTFLKQFASPALKAHLDAAHLSEFRRTKELVHEAMAHLDRNAAEELAIGALLDGVREFSDILASPEQDSMSDIDRTSDVVRRGIRWLDERGRFQKIEPLLSNTTASSQLRIKRMLLEMRRAVKDERRAGSGGHRAEQVCKSNVEAEQAEMECVESW
mmetsp:Transcript_5263/g.12528  ORF Transcript_5263/g.12528 Transcript_5263/m.12528 type:complete len:235 (+) Transcript_5263:51-755(+)